MSGFAVERDQELTLDRRGRLAEMYVLSPYVWVEDGLHHILLRVVPPRDDEPRLKMAEVFYGTSSAGLHFVMDEGPVIFPGPGPLDLDGCEDPTVLRHDGALHVWYTGWNHAEQTGRLLHTTGSGPRALPNGEIALDSVADFANPKEAAIARGEDGWWSLFFEYARDDASLIGRVRADTLAGHWGDRVDALAARPDKWDSWHLSPGPIVGLGGERPVMFYNGASKEAEWRIGWLIFDAELDRVVDRCGEPLIMPGETQAGWTDIAFVASAVEREDGSIALYYSVADRALRRAIVRPTG